jgi:hypothetical protein
MLIVEGDIMKELFWTANDPQRPIWLTPNEAEYVRHRMLIDSGLDLDTYMSLIDPDWPSA